DVMVYRSEGKPLVALAAIPQHDPLALLVTQDSGIEEPEALRGKRVMLDYGAHDASILAMLKQAGVTAESYTLQPTSYNPLDLVEGKTDAFNAYITDQGFILDELGVGNRYLHPSRYGIDFYSDILVTTEQEIEQHPQRMQRFYEASMKGWGYAMSHTEALIDLILEKYNTQNRSRAHLQYEAAQMREMVQPLLVQLGYMHRERWLHIQDTFKDLGFLQQEVDIDALYYRPQPKPSVLILEQLLLPLLGVASVMGIIIFLVILWNRKLKQQVARRTRELERVKERIELILESMNEGLVVTDANHLIQRVNQKLEQLVGVESGALQGRCIEEIFEDEGTLFDQKRTILTDDQQAVPVHVQGALLKRQEGEEVAGGAVLVIYDLRNQVRAEQQEQYALFQAGVADMGASVLHNIGNVVTGMSGHVARIGQNTKLLNKLSRVLKHYLERKSGADEKEGEADPGGEDEIYKILTGTVDTLDKIGKNIADRGALDKLDQGIRHIGEVISIQQKVSRPVMHATRFSLKVMVEETLNLIEDRMDKYRTTLKLEMDPTVDSLLLPRNPLIQLLLNLLKNSLEAVMEEMLDSDTLEGRLVLTVKRLEENVFLLQLADNGCGAEAEQVESIFRTG
ncbi:MAG: ABC transporter substrate-binding protein, partial [Gammaproteobacteria bacterium]|nr:ABC transporter substrate-binding protein [Gammaproteobacteria bacterium]